jgi:hypothetical protein
MTSSNLVPTPIVNKNGVQTTVYKAAGGPSSSPVGNLPAPALGGVVSVTRMPVSEIMSDLIVSFDDPWITIPSNMDKATVRRTLEGYPEDTQRYIREVQSRQPDDNFFDRMLISMIYNRDSPETIEDALYVFDSLEDSWDNLTSESGWTDDRFDVDDELIRAVRGARGYGVEECDFGTEDKPLRHYDELTRKQALALITLYYEMSMNSELQGGLGHDDVSAYITDKSTVRHVVNNPDITHDMIVDMVDEMLTHGRTDWDVIESMNNAPSVPLREGTL